MDSARAVFTHIDAVADRIKNAISRPERPHEWFSNVGQFGDDFFSCDD